MKRLLVLNLIVDPGTRDRFDRETWPRVAPGVPIEVARLSDAFPGPEGRSHLLLSGSELSAAERNERDDDVCRTVREFVDAGRPVLGICYGHQMIARALAGDDRCRKAARPELGWRRIALRPDPLFAGVGNLVSACSHYDEVHGLPGGFEVLGGTDACAVQAMRLRGAPVWGVQFHPEVDRGQGEGMFARNLDRDPSLADHFHEELEDPSELEGNLRIFENFLGTGPA
jgi:GMP synthase-like glutamine amidotransferase